MKKPLLSFAAFSFISIAAVILLFNDSSFGQPIGNGNGKGLGNPPIGGGLGQPFWNLNGNAGTANSFAGTTNNFPFLIKVNNVQRASFTNNGMDLVGNFHSTFVSIDSIINSWKIITDEIQTITINAEQYFQNDTLVNLLGMQSEVSNLQTTVGNQQSELDNAQSEISNINSEILNHDSSLFSIQQQVSGIQPTQWLIDTVNSGNIYYDGGKVGIGTSAPAAKLDVFGSQRITGNLFVGGEVTVSDKFSAQTVASDTAVATKRLYVNHNLLLGSDSGSTKSDITSRTKALTIQSDSTSSFDVVIAADNSSKIGIGTNAPTEKLSVDGNVSVSGNIQSTSITTANITITDKIESDTIHATKSLEVNNSLRLSKETTASYAEVSTKDTAVMLVLQKEEAGQVVIGRQDSVATPQAGQEKVKLTVVGNTQLSGDVNVSGGVKANCVTTSCLNVSGQTSFDSLQVANRIKTSRIVPVDGDSLIHFGENSVTVDPIKNLIYWSTNSNSLWKGMRIGNGFPYSSGLNALAIGNNVTASAENAITLGSGITNGVFINDKTNSLMVGFNTMGNSPTLFVGPGNGTSNSIGKVGIGTNNPSHILEVTSSLPGAGTIIHVSNNGTGANEGAAGIYLTPGASGVPVLIHSTVTANFQQGPGKVAFKNMNDSSNAMVIDMNRKCVAIGSAYASVQQGPLDGLLVKGNVGIGITAPLEKLDVAGSIRIGASTSENTIKFYGLTGDNPSGYDHTVIAERLFNGNDQSELLFFKGNDPDACSSCGDRIRFDTPGSIVFQTGPNTGSNVYRTYDPSTEGITRMVINSEGNIGIQTTTPDYPLDVCGTVRAKEFRANLLGCDFVFEKNYSLLPLNYRKDKVMSDKHLPNILSAEKMINGTDIGITTMGILQNMEEHELYLYQHEEKIAMLYELIRMQSKKIDELEKLLKQKE